ncbi:MAG: universal stress protein [Verrucomicrobiota bacterium]|nr:universal stress protein [Verrucomicrobiota bacterium]
MRVLICSDGTDTADLPARIGGLVAGPCGANVTLLGIAEQPEHQEPLRAALELEAQLLGSFGVTPEIVLRAGEPIDQILQQTSSNTFDLVIIGARVKQAGGRHRRSQRTYEVIKAIPAPVLVAAGERENFAKFLVCTGGKRYIEAAVKLTGEIAKCAGASVTLLHVMAEPPAIYADLVRLEEDVDALLAAGSELGQNLRLQKERLEKMGVRADVRVRHGIVLEQVFRELHDGGYDMIVTGSSQARGALQHYIMGDLTKSIVDRARCPVLVARSNIIGGGILASLRRIFASDSTAGP